MPLTPYAVLGVQPDADADTIKRGFRLAASAAHPDRQGGSVERMAAVNAAYEVLSDPERRARYDRTGDVEDLQPVDAQARDMLMQVLSEALQSEGNLIAVARVRLDNMIAAMRANADRGKAHVAKLTRRRAQVRVESGDNLVHSLIDQQLTQTARQLEDLATGQAVAARALQLLSTHSSDEPSHGYTVWATSSGTTGGRF